MDNQNSQFLTEKIRTRLKEILFVLIAAIIFSFLVGILANIIVNYSLGVTINQNVIVFFLVSIVILLLLSYLLYYFYALKPNLTIEKEIIIPIVFNQSYGLVIDDPFSGGGYYPQKMAWQAFSRIIKEKPDLKDKLKKGISPKKKEKHIITELLEYIIILSLKEDLHSFGEKEVIPDKTVKNLPKELETNTFIHFFRRLKSTDIVDIGMSQLDFELPKDIEIEYWSPVAIKGLPLDPNTFKIGLTGEHCEVYLTVRHTSCLPIWHMTCGPAPMFEGIYINPYFQDALRDNLGKLIRVTFHSYIEAKFKLRWKLFPPSGYMNWAEKWINRFIKGVFFNGFDFNQVKVNKIKEIPYETYEAVKMNQKCIEDIEKEIRKIRNEVEKREKCSDK